MLRTTATPLRLFQVAMVPATVSAFLYGPADTSNLAWAAFAVFLLYIVTVQVRDSKPTEPCASLSPSRA